MFETKETISFCKHPLSLSLFQGEYVAPERIENIFIQSRFVAQVFVYGNGYKVSNRIGFFSINYNILFSFVELYRSCYRS